MPRSPRVAAARLAAALPLLLLPAAAGAQDVGTGAQSPVEIVDELMSRYGPDTPGGVVAIIRAGEIEFARAYGSANLTHGIPFEPGTVTNIGSTAKQFTGFALALLADRGVLSLDDDVRDHVPELPDLGETVTLRHLASHTSGYREFLNTLLLEGRRLMEGDHIDPAEVIEIVRRQPRLQNAPGAEFNYNNTGFHVLALVIERSAGVPFAEFMETEVWGPLGMDSTTVRTHPGEIVPNSAAGYVDAEGGFREVRDVGAAAGAGGVYTTVGDLARWIRNLRTGELGGPAVIEMMTAPFELNDGESTSYGLGLFVDTNRGQRRIHHGGGDSAHRSTFVYYPDLDAAYIVLSNHGSFPPSIPAGVRDAFFGEHLEGPAAASGGDEAREAVADFEVASFDAYVGRYALDVAPNFVLTVSRDGDRFLVQATGQPPVEVRPISDSTFALTVVDARITFHRDNDGVVRSLTLHQNGDHGASRLADETVDLEAFAGRYFSEELETFYTLEVEDGTLGVRHRRFGTIPLTHAGGDRFSGTMPIADITFERDEEGRVRGFRVGFVRARDILFERVDG